MAAVAALPVGLQPVVWLGAALLLLMMLEGLHTTFFPRRTLKRLAARYLTGKGEPQPDAPPLANPAVSAGVPRRWQRPEPARPKSFSDALRRLQK